MSEHPPGWESVSILDVLAQLEDGRIIHQGWSPQCAQGTSPSSDVWGVLKTTSIQNGRFLPEHNKLLPDALEPRPLLEVHKGDILLTCAGPRIRCGVPCLVRSTRPKLIISGKMYRMRAKEPDIDSRFVEAMLRAPVSQNAIDGIKTGMSESGMNLTHARFAKLEIPVPPTNEQKRIADKLGTVLARVEACRDHLDRIPAILKRFRQSVLAAATSGKLTEDWRKEHLEHQIHMQPFTESESRSLAWQEGTLANLLIGKPRNGYSPRAVEYKTAVKSLTLTATTSGRFKAEHFKYIDEDISQESHLWLNPGDILIQRANTLESVGVSAIYDGPPLTFIYPDLMMKAKANELVETKFLHYLLLSEPVRRHFRDNATGTAGNMPKINQPTVLSAPVSWPLHVEQTEIIRRVESLFAYSDRLEVRYHAARNQVEKLPHHCWPKPSAVNWSRKTPKTNQRVNC